MWSFLGCSSAPTSFSQTEPTASFEFASQKMRLVYGVRDGKVYKRSIDFSNPKKSKVSEEKTKYSHFKILGKLQKPSGIFAFIEQADGTRCKESEESPCQVDFINNKDEVFPLEGVTKIHNILNMTVVSFLIDGESWKQVYSHSKALPTTPLLPKLEEFKGHYKTLLYYGISQPNGLFWPIDGFGEPFPKKPGVIGYKNLNSTNYYLAEAYEVQGKQKFGIVDYKNKKVQPAIYTDLEVVKKEPTDWILLQKEGGSWNVFAVDQVLGEGATKTEALIDGEKGWLAYLELEKQRKETYKKEKAALDANMRRILLEKRQAQAQEHAAKLARHNRIQAEWCTRSSSDWARSSLNYLQSALGTCKRYVGASETKKIENAIASAKNQEAFEQSRYRAARVSVGHSYMKLNYGGGTSPSYWQQRSQSRKHNEFMRYINGSSSYDPYKSYRGNR